MKKLLGLAGIVLASSAGCTSFNYGAKDTLYLMGPHGEPAPVKKSNNAFQGRSAVFVDYITTKGEEVTILNYYQGHRAGSCEPDTYLLKMNDDGKLELPLVEIVISKKGGEVYSTPLAVSPAKVESPVLPTQETPIPTPPQRSSGIALPPSSSK